MASRNDYSIQFYPKLKKMYRVYNIYHDNHIYYHVYHWVCVNRSNEYNDKHESIFYDQDYNPCLPGDTTCYCIPLGICYSVTQVMVIDNCVIDQFSNDALEVHYTIFTLSGYTVSSFVSVCSKYIWC